MTSSKNKHPRTFQCREPLWVRFEQMAAELECSIDYLINDAMKQYARQRGYAGESTEQSVAGAPSPLAVGAPVVPPPPAAGRKPPPPKPPSSRPPSAALSSQPPPLNKTRTSPALAAMPAPGNARKAPPQPPYPPQAPHPPQPAHAGRGPSVGAGFAQHSGQAEVPHLPGAQVGAARRGRASLGLTIHYQGQAFTVTKDRYIIGRGKQTSDLTIKDPNVSRQHALIEFSSGQYYIVDMGSTNGVEFNGQRVQRKVIGDGDRFRICDHELIFGFQ